MKNSASSLKSFAAGMLTVFLVVLFFFNRHIYGWTNPIANPTTASSTLFYSGGNVGIGTSTPAFTLDVVGDINVSGNVLESNQNVLATSTIMFMNLSACPTGWAEYTAARGRYIVGLPSGGTLDGTAGTALTASGGAGENRVVGAHTHNNSLSISSHTPTATYVAEWQDMDAANLGGTRHPVYDAKPVDTAGFGNPDVASFTLSSVASGISYAAGNPSGATAGTNAPYIQLLVCQKS